jgi:hypothetical protein
LKARQVLSINGLLSGLDAAAQSTSLVAGEVDSAVIGGDGGVVEPLLASSGHVSTSKANGDRLRMVPPPSGQIIRQTVRQGRRDRQIGLASAVIGKSDNIFPISGPYAVNLFIE